MKDRMKNTIYDYIVWFTLYSVIGWCYEVFLEVVVYRWGFSNRGVLFGPYCPVYGVGAMIFLFLVYPMIRERKGKDKMVRVPLVFLLCMLTATALELITSYILGLLMGSWPWQTYVDYKINFQGRIALSPSLRFGLGGVIFLYLLQPFFERVCDRMGEKRVRWTACIFGLIFLLDAVYTFLLKG